MDQAAQLFLGLQRRIGRQQWWVGFVVLMAFESAYFWLTDPGYYAAPVASLASTVANVIFLFPTTALTVKRCNDRDWPWWLGYVVQLPLLAFIIGDYFGSFADDENLTALQFAVYLSFAVAILFIVIDNGLLKGTTGTNRFGPDPLNADMRNT